MRNAFTMLERQSRTGVAAFFARPLEPLELGEFSIAALGEGDVLVRIRLATICGSDANTWLGQRVEPMPSILGHEAYGEVADWGGNPPVDYHGRPLDVGDAVTWGINSFCGSCVYCENELEQKCLERVKYGHVEHRVGDAPAGCFSQYIVLRRGTPLFALPQEFRREVVLANCAVATAVHAVRALEPAPGNRVAVFGGGVLGLAVSRLLVRQGVRVTAIDFSKDRCEWARRLGVEEALRPERGTPPEETAAQLRKATRCGEGLDGAIEACGSAPALACGLASLRLGGRLVIAGSSKPVGSLPGDASDLLKRCLTVRGIHNYRPTDLAEAVAFLTEEREAELLAGMVSEPLPLCRINEGIEETVGRRGLRVAIDPWAEPTMPRE